MSDLREVRLSGNEIPSCVLDSLVRLTGANMESLYNNTPNWPNWSFPSKRAELLDTKDIQFILLLSPQSSSSHEQQALTQGGEEEEEEERVRDVLSSLVDQVAGLALEEQGEVVGFVAFHPWEESDSNRVWTCKYIDELQVSKAFQGRGVGKRLLHSVESEARQEGCPNVIFTVLTTNESAKNFYQRQGYSIDESCPSVLFQTPSLSYRIMSKPLQESDSTNVYVHECGLCEIHVAFRFSDGLKTHECLEHMRAWPYRCRICLLGTVNRLFFFKHLDNHRLADVIAMKRMASRPLRYCSDELESLQDHGKRAKTFA